MFVTWRPCGNRIAPPVSSPLKKTRSISAGCFSRSAPCPPRASPSPRHLPHKHIPVTGIQKDKSYPTVTKTRILAGMPHAWHQQVVRVDREPEAAPEIHLPRELIFAARQYLQASDALLVSDY